MPATCRRLKLFSRKRGKEEDPDSEAGDIVAPPADSDDESQQTYASSRKRRSVSMDLPSQFPSQRVSFDRPSGRTSLEIWHEARRTRCVVQRRSSTAQTFAPLRSMFCVMLIA